MTSIPKNLFIDKLSDIVEENSNTYRSTIKMKHADVYSNTYIDFGVKNTEKDTKFKFGDHVRISKYKNISAKVFVSNWSEEVFMIKKN